MATKYYTGQAPLVRHKTKVIYSVLPVGATYTISVGGKSLSVVPSTNSMQVVTDSVIEQWNASDDPILQEFVAVPRYEAGTLSGVEFEARTPGVPAVFTATVTGSSAVVIDTAIASGPGVWNAADNWSGNTLPAAGDTLVLRDGNYDIGYGLVDATNYAKLIIESSFTGTIGLPSANPNGYPEYRERYLKLGTGADPIAIEIGQGDYAGSTRLNINTNGAVTAATVFKTANPNGLSPAVDLIGPSGASVGYVYGGRVKISGTLASVNTRSGTTNSSAYVDLTDATVATVSAAGGTVIVGMNATDVIARDSAKVTVKGSAVVTNVECSSNANVSWESSGDITTLIVQGAGVVNFGNVATPKTVGTCEVYAGGTLRDPGKMVTWTTGIKIKGCRIADVSLDLGFDFVI